MTSPHAYAFRFTRSGDGYAVGHLPTLDALAADPTLTGRHLGTVRRLSQEWQSLSPKWQATAPDGTSIGTHYRSRDEAARALLVTADRVAALDALPTGDEPVEEALAPVEEPAPAEPVEVVHLGDDYLLDACGTAPRGEGLVTAPFTTPDAITCPACRPLIEQQRRDTVEADHAEALAAREADADTAAGTDADRVTILARASDLRPGDLVVDSLGNRQHAAFDVALDDTLRPGSTVKVWTAVADQERGLPPVLLYSAGRELLVSRRVGVDAWAELLDEPAPAVHLRTNAEPDLSVCGEDGPLRWTTDEVTCPACIRDAVARYEAHARFLRANRPEAWPAAEQDEAAAAALRARLDAGV